MINDKACDDYCRIIRCRHCKHWKQATGNTGRCGQFLRGQDVMMVSINWCCFAQDEHGFADYRQWEV